MNGFRLGKFVLKCSFGTSKYCANFLTHAFCEAFATQDKSCPFLHYLERARDKVIQDDPEFREYLNMQDSIANDFLRVLGLRDFHIREQSTEYHLSDVSFPSAEEIYGEAVNDVLTLRVLDRP